MNAAGSSAEHPVRGAGAGGGAGRKTLTQFCAEERFDLEDVQSRLAKRGIKASADQTLREIAVDNGYDRPSELLEIIRQN